MGSIKNQPKVAQLYDSLSGKYDERYSSSECWEENRAVFAWILEGTGGSPRPQSVLDLGAGTGLALDMGLLSGTFLDNYKAVDPSRGMLDRLQEKHPQARQRYEMTAEDFLRDYPEAYAEVVLALFGSASYLRPETIRELPKRVTGAMVLMHYVPGYFPEYHDESTAPEFAEESREAALEIADLYPSRVERLNNFQVVLIGGRYVRP